MSPSIRYIAFTKHWKALPLPQMAAVLTKMGFEGVQLPVRPGFQVEPGKAGEALPEAQRILTGAGLPISSVAAPLEREVFSGCARAGIPHIRVMFTGQDASIPFEQRLKKMRQTLDSALPLCREYGVKIAVQPHYGPGISNSMELYHLLQNYDPARIGAVWDAGHAGLAGEAPEQGLDILWPYLTGVNLKAAYYRPANGPESACQTFKPYFTDGRHGLCSWQRTAAYLKRRRYAGPICIFAEYTDEELTPRLAERDLLLAKELMREASKPTGACF